MINQKTRIWVDADACPKVIKEVIFKVSGRLKIEVILVANSYMTIPESPYITFVKVESGADVADNYISSHCTTEDIVVTADLPLAGDVVKKESLAINPRGDIYDEETICEKLSMRDFMTELRDSGMITGGPEAFSDKDKITFTNSLNKILAQKKLT